MHQRLEKVVLKTYGMLINKSHIPIYEQLNTPKMIKLGNTNGVDILIPASLFDNAYDEIVFW